MVSVVVAALVAHVLVWRLVLRLMRDRALASELSQRCRWPARVVVALAALLLALSTTRPRAVARGTPLYVLVLALIAAMAWLAIRLVRVAEGALMRRYDVPDNLRARRVRTEPLAPQWSRELAPDRRPLPRPDL